MYHSVPISHTLPHTNVLAHTHKLPRMSSHPYPCTQALLWRQKLVWTASEENRDHTKYSLRDPPSFVLPSVEKTLEKIKQRRNDDADASADVKEQAAEPVPRFAYEMVDGVMQVKWYTGAKRVIQDNENTNKNSNSNTASAVDGDDERDQTTKSENKHNSNSNSREPESEREKVDLDTYEPTNFAKDVNDDEDEFELIKAPSRDVFSQALMEVMGAIAYGPMKTFAYSRLKILEARFNLHGK